MLRLKEIRSTSQFRACLHATSRIYPVVLSCAADKDWIFARNAKEHETFRVTKVIDLDAHILYLFLQAIFGVRYLLYIEGMRKN